MKVLEQITFAADGLVPAIVQDEKTGEVLMMAWMNKESLRATVETKRATYWSRSRQKFWIKGEESGNYQDVTSVQVDCDGDVVLLKVRQHGGGACHTGHRSCFYRTVIDNGNGFEESDDIVFDPNTVYKKR